MLIKFLIVFSIVSFSVSCDSDKNSTHANIETIEMERSYESDKKQLEKFASLGPYVELKKEDNEDCNNVTASYQISVPPSAGEQLKQDIELIADMLAKENFFQNTPDADCNAEPISVVYLFDSKESFDNSKWLAKCTVTKNDIEGKTTFSAMLR